MHRLALLATLAAALPTLPRAAPPRAEGQIDSGEGRVEILGKPVRVGERIELPEGYLIVEEQGTEDRDVGSFSIVPAPTFAATAPAPAEPADAAAAAEGPAAAPASTPVASVAAAAQAERPCRAERTAYLRELWKSSGIEVSDPERVIEGLEGGGQGARLGFYWFALATDPFRPMAWSSELRSRADALARCVRDGAVAQTR
jgi:hypothetical protein